MAGDAVDSRHEDSAFAVGEKRGGQSSARYSTEYVKRIGRSCPIEVTDARDATAALKKLDADRAGPTAVLLDVGGKSYDSESFAKWLGSSAIAGRGRSFRVR